MSAFVEATLALTLGYLLASSSYFLGRLEVRWRFPLFVLVSSLLLACPLLISGQRSLLRGILTGVIVFLWLKVWDASWNVRRASANTLPDFLMHLLNFGWLVGTPGSQFPKQPFPGRAIDFVGWCVGLGGTVLPMCWAFTFDWERLPFLVEHGAKALIILVALLCAFNAHAALWRLAGVASLSSPLSALFAGCPAEFWRRWNRPVSRWYGEHIFNRVGGVKRPFVAILITFAVSGLMHEYLVAMFAGRVTGGPSAFWLVQGCAAGATFRLHARGWEYAVAVPLTFVFNVVSSVLLFAPLDAGLSFYQNDVFGWLWF